MHLTLITEEKAMREAVNLTGGREPEVIWLHQRLQMGKWTKKSNAPHPVTRMYHGCEKTWRIGAGITKAEIEANKLSDVPEIEFSKFFDSIPNLLRTPNNVSTRLRADCNKIFDISGDYFTKGSRSNYWTTDTYSKHVLNVGFPAYRWRV